MGVIYVNDGFRKSKQPVDLKQSSVDIRGGSSSGLDYSVEDGNLIISQDEPKIDQIVEDELLNIL